MGKFTPEQEAALAAYDGPVTQCPPMPALGAWHGIMGRPEEDLTIPAHTIPVRPKRPRVRPPVVDPDEEGDPSRGPRRVRTYHGPPCPVCGGTERRDDGPRRDGRPGRKLGPCIACAHRKAREWRQRKRKETKR